MNIIANLRNRQFVSEGEGKPVPSEGAGRYFCLLGMHFWKLVQLNLLLIAFSLPIFTFPAALCGVNRVCVKLIREGNVFLWDEFITEFKASFVKSLWLGIIFAILLFGGYYLLSLGISNAQSIWSVVFIAFGLTVFVFSLALSSYVFVLVPMLPLGNKALLKNARSLIMLKPLRALCVIAFELAMAIVAAALFPISFFLLATCWPMLIQYTVCFLVNTPVQQFIIAPYEAEIAKKEKNPS